MGREFPDFYYGPGLRPFATPENIQPWLDKQFADLRDENFLQGFDAGRFAARAAHYVNEINAAHPFLEGNGRMQRAWLRILAEQAGHHVRLRSENRERWYEASRIGFENANPGPMAELIRESLSA